MDLEFLLRISVCFVLSIVIGLERQYRHKMVGLRTNVLVSLGAFMFNWVTFCDVSTDKTRIAAQVVSGIGFLGAGVILRDGSKIKGLNTAATLWCVAAIGVMTSSGLLIEAAVGTLFVLISNVLLRLVSMMIMEKVQYSKKEVCEVKITCESDIEVVIRSAFAKFIEKNRLNLISLSKQEVGQDKIKLKGTIITTRADIIDSLIKTISVEPGVFSVSWSHKKYRLLEDSNDSDEDDE